MLKSWNQKISAMKSPFYSNDVKFDLTKLDVAFFFF